jgi:hypothetical protein
LYGYILREREGLVGVYERQEYGVLELDDLDDLGSDAWLIIGGWTGPKMGVHLIDSLSDSVSVICGWPMFGLDSGQRGTRDPLRGDGSVRQRTWELETGKWGNADWREIGVTGNGRM